MSHETLIQLGIGLGLLVGIVVLGVLVVQRFRGSAADDGVGSSDLLSKFQEMRHEGDISETEYRTIKSVLGQQLKRDVKDGKNKG